MRCGGETTRASSSMASSSSWPRRSCSWSRSRKSMRRQLRRTPSYRRPCRRFVRKSRKKKLFMLKSKRPVSRIALLDEGGCVRCWRRTKGRHWAERREGEVARCHPPFAIAPRRHGAARVREAPPHRTAIGGTTSRVQAGCRSRQTTSEKGSAGRG